MPSVWHQLRELIRQANSVSRKLSSFFCSLSTKLQDTIQLSLNRLTLFSFDRIAVYAAGYIGTKSIAVSEVQETMSMGTRNGFQAILSDQSKKTWKPCWKTF